MPPAADLFGIALPASRHGNTVMYMHRLGGRDQIVATAERASWTEFERPLPALMHATIAARPGLVVDVGANTGFYTLLAASASADARVLAFEPDPPVFDILCRNVAANGLQERIETIERALSRSAGAAMLYVPTQKHGLVETSSSLERGFKDAHSKIRPVETATLDGFLAAHRWGEEHVILVKVDVEGHEAAVLAGAGQTVARWRPLLVVEILPRADLSGLRRFLAEHAYVDVPLRTESPLCVAAELRFHSDAWNHVFVAAEEADMFLDFAHDLPHRP